MLTIDNSMRFVLFSPLLFNCYFPYDPVICPHYLKLSRVMYIKSYGKKESKPKEGGLKLILVCSVPAMGLFQGQVWQRSIVFVAGLTKRKKSMEDREN